VGSAVHEPEVRGHGIRRVPRNGHGADDLTVFIHKYLLGFVVESNRPVEEGSLDSAVRGLTAFKFASGLKIRVFRVPQIERVTFNFEDLGDLLIGHSDRYQAFNKLAECRAVLFRTASSSTLRDTLDR